MTRQAERDVMRAEVVFQANMSAGLENWQTAIRRYIDAHIAAAHLETDASMVDITSGMTVLVERIRDLEAQVQGQQVELAVLRAQLAPRSSEREVGHAQSPC